MFPLPFLFVAAASAATIDSDQLGAQLKSTYTHLMEPYLVGAVGVDAEKAVQRALRSQPGTHVELVRMPTIGDAGAEMTRALGKAGMRCGLYIKPEPADRWTISQHGDCRSVQELGAEAGPAAGPAAPPVVLATDPEPAPTPPAAQSDPSSAAWQIARLERSVPDPNTALLQSTILGFGAGHFYAHNSRRGGLHLALQLGGIGLSALGFRYGMNANSQTEAKLAEAMVFIGSGVFAGDRVFDIFTAPMSAHDEAEERLQRGRQGL